MQASRILARAALVLLTVPGVCFVPLSTVAANDGRPYSHLQWNMCGVASQCQSRGGFQSADALIRSVQSRSPIPRVVTLQEVCGAQFDYLASRLNVVGIGYGGALQASKTGVVGCGGDQQYGNAVFWQNGSAGFFSYVYSNQAAGATELRNYVCGDGAELYNTVCSTHLVADNKLVARKQLGELKNFMNSRTKASGSRATWFGGDLNLDPQDNTSPLEMKAMFDRYDEADGEYRAGRDTLNGVASHKYDYIFTPKDSMHNEKDAYISGTTTSDHKLIEGFPYWDYVGVSPE